MTSPQRQPDLISTVPGTRRQQWTAHVYWADSPDPEAWQRAKMTIVDFLLPKVRELVALERERTEAARHRPQYVEEGI